MIQGIQLFILGQIAMTAFSIIGCFMEKYSSKKAKNEAKEQIRRIEAKYMKQSMLLEIYQEFRNAQNSQQALYLLGKIDSLESETEK